MNSGPKAARTAFPTTPLKLQPLLSPTAGTCPLTAKSIPAKNAAAEPNPPSVTEAEQEFYVALHTQMSCT